MTRGREWKLIILFTLPIIACSLLQQLYNTVDGIVVGNYIGDNAFAGVGTCNALGFLFLGFAMGLGSGISVTVSQYYGARRHGELSTVIDTSLIIMGAVGLVLSIVGFFVTPFLLKVLLKTPDEILPYAVLYFKIYSISLFFQFIYNGVSFALRGMGDSKASLYFLIVTTVTNAILSVIFVIGFNWGVAGTGTATVISQFVCALLSYIYLKKRCVLEKTDRHFDKTACLHILRFGIPSALQQSITAVGSGAMQRLTNSFGPYSISGVTAASRINMLLLSPVFGFQAGLSTFTGQNIGAGRLDRVKRGLRSTLLIALSLTVAVCTFIYIAAPSLIKIFALEGEALKRGVEMLRFYGIFFVAFGYQLVIGGILQGAGDFTVQSIATLTALAIRITFGYLSVQYKILDYNAVWVSDVVSWSALIIILTARFISGRWKNKAAVSLSEAEFCREVEV
jgi:putative MATE family efflux protein